MPQTQYQMIGNKPSSNTDGKKNKTCAVWIEILFKIEFFISDFCLCLQNSNTISYLIVENNKIPIPSDNTVRSIDFFSLLYTASPYYANLQSEITYGMQKYTRFVVSDLVCWCYDLLSVSGSK